MDVKSTAALDADLETQRQNLFIQALKLLAKKLRVKREISSEQEKSVSLKLRLKLFGICINDFNCPLSSPLGFKAILSIVGGLLSQVFMMHDFLLLCLSQFRTSLVSNSL